MFADSAEWRSTIRLGRAGKSSPPEFRGNVRPLTRALAREDREERAELDFGLVELGGGVGVADDAHACVEAGLGVAEEGAAEGDAEFAVVVGVGPADGSRVPASVEAFEGGDEGCGVGVGLAADGWGWVEQAGELDGADRVGELGSDRGGEVLDVGDLDDLGLVGGGDPDRVGPKGAGDAADDDGLFFAVLVGAQELFAEVVVDGGVGGAAGGAGEGDGLGAVAVAADQQLG